MNEKVFKMPNSLIKNLDNFYPSTIGIAGFFYSSMSKHRKFTYSLKRLAVLSHRDEDTARQAVGQLEQAGYIKRCRNFIYSASHGRSIYAQATYQTLHPVKDGYTLIPYFWIKYKLTPCTMQILLVCRMFMVKQKDRAHPSTRKIALTARVAKSSVHRALKEIVSLSILIIERCKKENGVYTSNWYFILKKCTQVAVSNLTSNHSQQSQHRFGITLTQLHFSLELSYYNLGVRARYRGGPIFR